MNKDYVLIDKTVFGDEVSRNIYKHKKKIMEILDQATKPLKAFYQSKEGTWVWPKEELKKCNPHNFMTDLEEKRTYCVRCDTESVKEASLPERISNKQRIDLSGNVSGQRELLRMICNRYNELITYLEKTDRK